MSNGLDLLRLRLGNKNQQERMIKDKKRSLDRALVYSYHAAEVQRANDEQPARALINPNQLYQDYDEKVLSIGFEYDYHVGDVFEWKDTKTMWLAYKQELTELAYFRSAIRRCRFEISWLNENGEIQKTYAAIIGPEAESINSITKYGINIDLPNYKIHLMVPSNPETTQAFQRYTKFYLKNLAEPYNNTCWRIEAVDAFSAGVLDIYAQEYYANEYKDDIELGIVDGLTQVSEITGAEKIKPKQKYTYIYEGNEVSNWLIENRLRLPIKYQMSDKILTIEWTATYSGQIKISYGSTKKVIFVDSLF